MHRNPVERGLAGSPEEWGWSSYRFCLLEEAGPVRVNEAGRKFRFERRQRDRTPWCRQFRLPPFDKLRAGSSQRTRRTGHPLWW